MKLKNALLYTLLLIGSFSIAAESAKGNAITSVEVAAPQADFRIHSVKKGETISSIARMYDLTVEDIYKVNKWAERGIRTGDKLKIPVVKADKSKNATTVTVQNKPDKPIAGYKTHVIETKQTLYSLALIYNVTVEDLLRANPGLNEKNFQIGKTIQIPVYVENLPDTPAHVSVPAQGDIVGSAFIEHKVQKRETIYGISKAYNITEKELVDNNPLLVNGLKTDMTLLIPRKQSPNDALPQLPLIAQPTPTMQKGDIMRIGILLPFAEKNGSISQEKLLEYYNGFLLGVRELKEKGYNAEIYTFDIGAEKDTKKLKSLLETVEMNNLHLVIGGISPAQINILSDFSVRTGIKYVIPFGNKKPNMPANIFQMTTPHSYLYPKIATIFRNKFKDHNIIFLSEVGSDNNKQDFVNELKKELTAGNIPFKAVTSSEDVVKDLRASIALGKKNMLVPTSSSEVTLKKIWALMNSMPKEEICLFGYPDWQAYPLQSEQLHKYDAYIYSIFFLDEKQSKAEKITEEYNKWYNKRMLNSYPKYAFLGYDAAVYFMTALNTYGSSFDENIARIRVSTMQSAVFFEPDIKDGGYVNTGVYFVRFKPDRSFEKTEYSR